MICTKCNIKWPDNQKLKNCPECGEDFLTMLNAKSLNPSVDVILKNMLFVYGFEFLDDQNRLSEKIDNLFCHEKRINHLLQLSIKYNIPQKLALLFNPRSVDLTRQLSILHNNIQEISFLSDDVLSEMFSYWSLTFTLSTRNEPGDGEWIDEFGVKYSADRRKLIKGSHNISYTILSGTEIICDSAFVDAEQLKHLIIPSSVYKVGDSGFTHCKNLTHIEVSNSNPHFKSIDGVLYDKELTTLLFYPQHKKEKSYIIPNSVTKICTNAFYDCDELERIVLPSSLLSIDNRAFRCSSLKSITLPSSVTSIGTLAFRSCVNLTGICVEKSNRNFRSIDGVLFDNSLETIIYFPLGKAGQDKTYIIPPSVRHIGEDAFSGCRNLESITISSATITIGASAFSSCTELKSIIIPNSVTSIGNYAFNSCDSLTSIIIPDSVGSVGRGTFSNCANLKEIELSKSISSIEDSTFFQCFNLSKIVIPDSILSIGSAFHECLSLKFIKIPASVIKIDNAFGYCENLTSIEVNTSNQHFSSINGVLFDKRLNTIILFPKGKARLEKRYNIPDSITKIAEIAFYECEGLKSLIIPNSVTEIGDYAFSGCNRLNSIHIPSSVISIGDGAFRGCKGLTSIVFPSKLSRICESAFNNCTNLSSIILPDSVSIIEDYAFQMCESIQYLNIPKSVKSIGTGAFSNCYNLGKIAILGSIDSIGDSAFAHSCIESIIIPASVTSINDAFFGCRNLIQIFISKENNYLRDRLSRMGYKDRLFEIEDLSVSPCSPDPSYTSTRFVHNFESKDTEIDEEEDETWWDEEIRREWENDPENPDTWVDNT